MKNLIFAIFLATCFIQCAENKHVNPTIKTPYGIYEGVYSCDNSVEIFWGVPFAEPPVGNLRFQPPQKCQPFDGIKKSYSDFIVFESQNIVDYLLYNKKFKTFYTRW